MKKISLLILVAVLFFTLPLGSKAYAFDYTYSLATYSNVVFSYPNLSFDITSSHYLNPGTFHDISIYSNDDSQTVWCTTSITPETAVSQSNGTIHISTTHMDSDVNNGGDCVGIPSDLTGYIIDWGESDSDGYVHFVSALNNSYMNLKVWPSALTTYTVEPTQQARINGAVSSIPNTAGSEIFAILPKVLPFILVVVAIGIAFLFVKKWMKQGNVAEGGETENSWVDSSEGIHEHLENRHVE